MLYFEFKNKSFNGNFVRISEHVIQIIGGVPTTSGFLVYKDETKQDLLGDYSDYTTMYRKKKNQLSNDGSIYVPPVVPVPEPRISILEKDGMEYNIVDFESNGDLSFYIKGHKEDIIDIFSDVSEIKVDGISFSDLKFNIAFLARRYDEEYIGVFIHVKTEQELDIEQLDETVIDVEIAIADNYEEQSQTNIDMQNAIVELYEMIIE